MGSGASGLERRDPKAAAARAVRLRREQTGLEEETRRASAAAKRMAALQTALEMQGEEPGEEHYQEHGAALDAWRTAKSRATAQARETAAAERATAQSETGYRQCLEEQRRIEEEVVPEIPGRSSPTNVAKLSELYVNNPKKDEYNTYIKGVGTVAKPGSQKDYTFLGLAWGLGGKAVRPASWRPEKVCWTYCASSATVPRPR